MWFIYQLTSTSLFAAVNVIDSVLVHRFHKNPFVLMWNQSFLTLFFLAIFSFSFEITTSWEALLLLAGFFAFISDVTFFRALRDLDTSVVNIAWALLSIFLIVASYLFLQETWSLMQSIGIVLTLFGASILSLWHQRIADFRSLLWLPLLAGLYTPFYFIQELALSNHQSVSSVFFWPLLGRECCAFVAPVFSSSLRGSIRQFASQTTRHFYGTTALVVLLFFMATMFSTLAFETGPVSLASIIGNAQPFLVIFMAWLLWKLKPNFSSKELLDSQSIYIKVISFIIVFAGLACLVLPK